MKKSSKGSKSVKKQPFAKRESSMALGLIVGLTVFNLLYSYAVGLPLPRAVVSSYVESVHALGDAQVRGYEAMGAVVVAAVTHIGDIPAGFNTASPSVAAEVVSQQVSAPEPLLLVAPNQISIAK